MKLFLTLKDKLNYVILHNLMSSQVTTNESYTEIMTLNLENECIFLSSLLSLPFTQMEFNDFNLGFCICEFT